MQHYVGLRPMFDLEVMNEDAKLVLGDPGSQPSPSNVARGLSSLYKEITGLNDSPIYRICRLWHAHLILSFLTSRYCTERSCNNNCSISISK